MKTELSDTSPEAERVLIEMVRRAPVWQRLAQVVELNLACRTLALIDLRERYPHASEEELHKRLAARLLPREDVTRAYGWDPEKEGY